MNDELFTPTGNWDNHKILLRLALGGTNMSEHPILELGCGDGSSPTLQEFVKHNHRELLSYDYDKEWAEKYGASHVKDWDEAVDWNKKYSVALVDESPGEQRHKSLMLLKNVCDIVIVHDSEPVAEEGYSLKKIWNLYKYKVDLVSKGAWATAMSNRHDVTLWAGMKFGEYEIRDWNVRNSIAFCSVAFGPQYVEQQERLKESILQLYPEAHLFFYKEELPVGSKPFLESLYGFKVHAIKEARDYGFKKVVWVDSAIVLKHKLDFEDSMVEQYGVLAVRDDNKLTNVCSDTCVKYFDIAKSDLDDRHLVGGSFYYFNFNYSLSRLIFDDWYNAEQAGIFGSQEDASSDKLQGHRHDETCMALAIYKNGSSPLPANHLKYPGAYTEEIWIDKKHFK